MSRYRTLFDLPARARAQIEAKLAAEAGTRAAAERELLDMAYGAPRRSKYNARKTVIDGITFDSKKEGRRYVALRQDQVAGKITGLRCHVRFSLFDPGDNCRGEHIATYCADFVYRLALRGEVVVEDLKSAATAKRPDWRRTKALMRACHGIVVLEVFRA